MAITNGHAWRCVVKRGPLTFSLPRKPSSEQNIWKWTRKQDLRIPCLMKSKSLKFLASQVLPHFLLRDGSALHKHKHTCRANSHESAASCAQGAWDTWRATRGGRDHPGQMGACWPWGHGLGERGTEWGFPELSWRKQARRRKCWLSQALWHDSQKRSQYRRNLEASEVVFNSWL